MTKTETDRRLALVIGYPADRVRINTLWADHFVQVLNDYSRMDGPMQFNGWQRFDHTDPAVIWPIAEKFDAWPKSLFVYCRLSSKDYDTLPPATALALAVIQYFESKE